MKKRSVPVITFVTAGILALAMSLSLSSTPHDPSPKEDVTAERGQTRPETGGLVPLHSLSSHSLSLPSVFQFRTNVLNCFLFEILQSDHPAEPYTQEVSLTANVFFEITFRFIISPNAP